jgi:L-ascorbate metabolism protein UlaG (beta-lactamase superfamily)
MEITWLGHSCFKLKGKNGTVITDPFGSASGYQLGKVTASIVTVSHDHPGHNFASGVDGEPKVITGPGEYEIAGIFIYGIRTFHDSKKGEERGKNMAYLIEIDDIKVCHLGDLGHVPSAAQLDEISDADVLLIPVGGGSSLDAATAIEVVNIMSPTFVIPMHYKTDVSTGELEPPDKFLQEMGMKEITPVPKLVINKSTMPLDMQTVVLDYKP